MAGRVVAGFGDLDLEPEIVPVRAAKEPFVFAFVDFRTREQFERNPAPAFGGPDQTARVALGSGMVDGGIGGHDGDPMRVRRKARKRTSAAGPGAKPYIIRDAAGNPRLGGKRACNNLPRPIAGRGVAA